MTQTVPQKRTATSFVAARFDQGVSRTVDFGEGSSEIHTLSQTEVNSAGFGHRPLAENRSPKTEADGQYGVSHTDAFNLTASNIGFKLLKKSGWKEGTGLGAAEQGIINPVPAFIKHGREGIGAEKEATINNYRVLKKKQQVVVAPKRKESKAQKRLSKRAKKVHAEEQRMLDHQFTRDFLREFWPDNV